MSVKSSTCSWWFFSSAFPCLPPFFSVRAFSHLAYSAAKRLSNVLLASALTLPIRSAYHQLSNLSQNTCSYFFKGFVFPTLWSFKSLASYLDWVSPNHFPFLHSNLPRQSAWPHLLSPFLDSFPVRWIRYTLLPCHCRLVSLYHSTVCYNYHTRFSPVFLKTQSSVYSSQFPSSARGTAHGRYSINICWINRITSALLLWRPRNTQKCHPSSLTPNPTFPLRFNSSPSFSRLSQSNPLWSGSLLLCSPAAFMGYVTPPSTQ